MTTRDWKREHAYSQARHIRPRLCQSYGRRCVCDVSACVRVRLFGSVIVLRIRLYAWPVMRGWV